MKSLQRVLPTVIATLMLAACQQASEPAAQAAAEGSAPTEASAPGVVATEVAEVAAKLPVPMSSTLPNVVVHRSPTCGCCGAWVEGIQQAGYPVEVIDESDLAPLKLALGVPQNMASCHTAIVGDYFIEGHVPAADIERLLMEKPDARGLVVPGMPVGSPGMEVPSGEVEPYTVFLVNKDGSTTPYSQYGR